MRDMSRSTGKSDSLQNRLVHELVALLALVFGVVCASSASENSKDVPMTQRIVLTPSMLGVESEAAGNVTVLVDEQSLVDDPPVAGKPSKGWDFDYRNIKTLPHRVVIDLGQERPVARF